MRKFFPDREIKNVLAFPDREVVARLGNEILKNTIGANLLHREIVKCFQSE